MGTLMGIKLNNQQPENYFRHKVSKCRTLLKIEVPQQYFKVLLVVLGSTIDLSWKKITKISTGSITFLVQKGLYPFSSKEEFEEIMDFREHSRPSSIITGTN